MRAPHGIAATWPLAYQCGCGAVVPKDKIQAPDHFDLHGVQRPAEAS